MSEILETRSNTSTDMVIQCSMEEQLREQLQMINLLQDDLEKLKEKMETEFESHLTIMHTVLEAKIEDLEVGQKDIEFDIEGPLASQRH